MWVNVFWSSLLEKLELSFRSLPLTLCVWGARTRPCLSTHTRDTHNTHSLTTMSALAPPPPAASTPLAQLNAPGSSRPPSSSGRKDGSGRATQKRAFDLVMR